MTKKEIYNETEKLYKVMGSIEYDLDTISESLDSFFEIEDIYEADEASKNITDACYSAVDSLSMIADDITDLVYCLNHPSVYDMEEWEIDGLDMDSIIGCLELALSLIKEAESDIDAVGYTLADYVGDNDSFEDYDRYTNAVYEYMQDGSARLSDALDNFEKCLDAIQTNATYIDYPGDIIVAVSGFDSTDVYQSCTRAIKDLKTITEPVKKYFCCVQEHSLCSERYSDLEYLMVDEEEFRKMRANGDFLEVHTKEAGGVLVGTPIYAVRRHIQQRQVPILVLDESSLAQIRNNSTFPKDMIYSVYILKSSWIVSKNILTPWRFVTQAERINSLRESIDKVKCMEEYDYVIVVNDYSCSDAELELCDFVKHPRRDKEKVIKEMNSFIEDMEKMIAALTDEEGSLKYKEYDKPILDAEEEMKPENKAMSE